MNWMTWAAILIAWPVVGLGVAYMFGRFTHRGEAYGNPGQLSPPVVSYLRRTKVASRAAAQAKVRREGSAGRRLH
jgi:hypothetical protein